MASEIFMGINYLLTGSLILFLLIPVQLYLLSLVMPQQLAMSDKPHYFCCIITSYGPPKMCELLIDSLLKGNYPHFQVIAVLDNTDETIQVEHPRVTTLIPDSYLHSKMKSIREALQLIDPAADSVVILDPDNLVHPDMLNGLNKSARYPGEIVQGQRRPKNTSTPLSKADAMIEAYYNITDRQLAQAAGSSATLAGSGFCISTAVLKDFIRTKENKIEQLLLGEDKLLQSFVVQHGLKIAYAREAIIYDEKISLSSHLRRQRARWINAYFENVRESGRTFIKGILATDWNMIIFGLITIRPPMFLNFSLLLLLLILNTWICTTLSFVIGAALILFSIFFLAVISKTGRISSLRFLPAFIFHQFRAFLGSGKYRREFGKTITGSFLSIEDVLRNDPS